MKMYDPPSGWQYGFPKPYNPKEGEPVRDTLIRDGYPPELADKNWPVRFWEHDSEPHRIMPDEPLTDKNDPTGRMRKGISQFASGLQLNDEDDSEISFKNNHGN